VRINNVVWYRCDGQRDMASTCSVLLRLILLAHLLMLALTAATTTSKTEQSPVVLTLRHVASTMTSITVSWSSNSSESNVTTTTPPIYHIEALSLATQVQLISPRLPANQTQYELPDLAVDAEYEICVVSSGTAASACDVFSTIAVVRDDSIIALVLALLVIAIVIIIAVILWRCAIRRAAAEEEETASEEKPDMEDDGLNEKSPLLVPTSAEPDQSNPPPADPTNAQPEVSKQEQPQSLYLFLAGHAFK